MGILDSITGFLTGGASKKATKAAKKAAAAYDAIQTPTAADLQYVLQEFVNAGDLEPAQYDAILQDPSAFESLTLDPTTRQAQMDALLQLQDISRQGGLTAIDRSRLNDIRDEELATERGQREALVQNAQQRGVGGSGIEMAAQLMNQQNSANRQSQRGFDVAAEAQRRALEALTTGANLAGNIRSADYQQASDAARASDAINAFNANQQNSAAQNNANFRQQTNTWNANNAQDIANKNTNVANAQAAQKADVAQNMFNNAITKAGGVSGAQSNLVNQYNQNANNNNNALGNLIGLGQWAFSDENLKEDVKPFDSASFLDEITGHKYKYKNRPDLPTDPQIGIMAQDLEKTPEGKALVKDTPNGKVIDYGKTGGLTFAILADLNKRLKDIE